MLEDGDFVREEEGDWAMIEGAAAIGQSIAFSLSSYFADLSDPEGFSKRVQLQGAPRPEAPRSGTYADRHEGFLAQTLWEMENNEEFRTTDPRDISVEQRIGAAINELSEYLESVLDVRFNGHDIEIDYHAFGYETHVLRIDGIVPVPGSSLVGWKRPLPIRRQSLLEVEDLTHRLIAHAKEDPDLLKGVPWRTFERIIAELLQTAGWRVIELTRASKDDGVDIYAALPTPNGSSLAVIDCKRYGPKIDVETVRAVAGLKFQHQSDFGAEFGVLVTTSYFTSGARALEQKQLRDHVRLYDFDRVKQWLAMHDWQCGKSGLYLPKSRFSKEADKQNPKKRK
jgi:hypothetical protein